MDIFADDADRDKFMSILADTVRISDWKCYAYCLMGNHYHLLIETADGDTSKGMKRLNGTYAQYFNWKHERVGSLFQGRYKAILIDRDSYFLELSRYIVLNPVRQSWVADPEEYSWSSYRVVAGLERDAGLIDRDSLLSRFSSEGDDDPEGVRGYVEFVRDGIDDRDHTEDIRGGIVLGDRTFLDRVKHSIAKHKEDRNIPKYQRQACRPEIDELLDPLTVSLKSTRDEAIRTAYFDHGFTQSEIADHLGVHNSTVFRIVRRNNSKNK